MPYKVQQIVILGIGYRFELTFTSLEAADGVYPAHHGQIVTACSYKRAPSRTMLNANKIRHIFTGTKNTVSLRLPLTSVL